MSESENMPEAHAASVARITSAEKNLLVRKSKAAHDAANQEMRSALDAHEAVFGKPFKRNGVWY